MPFKEDQTTVISLGESKDYEVVLFKRLIVGTLLVSSYYLFYQFRMWYYGAHPWAIATDVPGYHLTGFQALFPMLEVLVTVGFVAFLPSAYYLSNRQNTQVLILAYILSFHGTIFFVTGGFSPFFNTNPISEAAAFEFARTMAISNIGLLVLGAPALALVTRSLWIPMVHLVLSACFLAKFFVTYFFVRSTPIESSYRLFFESNYNVIPEDFLFLYGMSAGFTFLVGASLVFFVRYVVKVYSAYEQHAANLSRFFSPEISKQIESTGLNMDLNRHEESQIAILFTDIVGFTKLSEQLSPSATLKLLSEYQSLMVECIFKHSGTVDKFIGDAVMANFGTPNPSPNDAQNAFACALEMNRMLSSWNEERKKEGLLAVQHRIGIHFGECAVGNIGHERRIEYAVIGDPVNVASRLCDACKDLDAKILVSKALWERAQPNVDADLIADFSLRGREENVDVYRVQQA